jgi:hypothetical protein
LETEALVQATMQRVAYDFSSGIQKEMLYKYQGQMAQEDANLLKHFISEENEKYRSLLVRHMLEQSISMEGFHRNYDTLSRGLGIHNHLRVSV